MKIRRAARIVRQTEMALCKNSAVLTVQSETRHNTVNSLRQVVLVAICLERSCRQELDRRESRGPERLRQTRKRRHLLTKCTRFHSHHHHHHARRRRSSKRIERDRDLGRPGPAFIITVIIIVIVVCGKGVVCAVVMGGRVRHSEHQHHNSQLTQMDLSSPPPAVSWPAQARAWCVAPWEPSAPWESKAR